MGKLFLDFSFWTLGSYHVILYKDHSAVKRCLYCVRKIDKVWMGVARYLELFPISSNFPVALTPGRLTCQ